MPTTTTGKASEFITFSRTSNATVTDSDGKIKWAPHNLLLASEQFDASNWTKNISLIAANSIAAPNGTITADKLYPSTSGTKSGVLARPTAVEEQYTLSVYAKAGGKNFITFTDFSAGSARAWANLSTGAKTETAGYFLTVTDAGSGWWKCDFTQTAKVASPYAFFIVCDADSSDAVTVNGTDGIYLWGASLTRSDLGGMKANTSAYPMYNPTTPKNLLGFSEDFSNASWGKSNTLFTSNSIVAPNGLQTADLIYSVASTTGGSVFQGSGPIAWSSTSMVLFNLATGTVGTVTAGSFTSTSITPVGDGWYRCAAVKDGYTLSFYGKAGGWSSVALQTFSSEKMRLYPSTSSTAQTGTGDGTSGIYLWGAQLSDSASLDAYVPNYGAAPTAAAYYGPRLDADPVTLAQRGLLVEEARTNLLTYSAQFDNAAWDKQACSVTANSTTAPDGTTTADTLTGDGTSNRHYIQQSVTSGTARTLRFYAKAATHGFLQVYFAADGAPWANFDLTNGVLGSSGSNQTATITSVGNGWYACTVVTPSTTAANVNFSLISSATAPRFELNTVSGSVYLWGAQLEAGSFATSYIPTGAATATRDADVASVSTQAFPYSATEGTLVVNGNYLSSSVSANAGVDLYSDSNNKVSARATTMLVATSGSTVASFSLGSVNTAPAKRAVAYKANDFAACYNGGTVSTDTSGNVPSAALNVNFNVDASSFFYNGWIRQITYIPRRLNDADLTARTA